MNIWTADERDAITRKIAAAEDNGRGVSVSPGWLRRKLAECDLSVWRGSRITQLEAALEAILSLAAEQSADWPGASRAERIARLSLDT